MNRFIAWVLSINFVIAVTCTYSLYKLEQQDYLLNLQMEYYFDRVDAYVDNIRAYQRQCNRLWRNRYARNILLNNDLLQYFLIDYNSKIKHMYNYATEYENTKQKYEILQHSKNNVLFFAFFSLMLSTACIAVAYDCCEK